MKKRFSARKRRKLVLRSRRRLYRRNIYAENIGKISDKYPEEQFKIKESDSAKVVEEVINRQTDIGFTGTMLDKKHCVYIPFYEDELIVITQIAGKI